MSNEKGKVSSRLMSIVYRKVSSITNFYRRMMRSCVRSFRAMRSTFRNSGVERFRKYCSRLSLMVPEPYFVKVGANDGITGDPCSDILLSDTRWKGLLIEPVPYCYERLKKNFYDSRRFSLEQIAIGAPAGEATFYYVDPRARESLSNLPAWYDQLGSFDKKHILKHMDGALAPFILERTVEVCPLADVLGRKNVKDVHLLHIDTEGHDFEVLKTFDFSKHVPVVIFIEHKHLSDSQRKEMLHFLAVLGYSVRNCGGDYFAVNRAIHRRLRKNASVCV